MSTTVASVVELEGVPVECVSQWWPLTTVFNRRSMSVGVQYCYNLEHPDGAVWQTLRFVVSLLSSSAKK
jgi:hypothetical protein